MTSGRYSKALEPAHASVASLPALCDLATGTHHPLAGTAVFLVGRHPAANLILVDVTCSRQQFRIVRHEDSFVLEPLSANVPTRCDGQVVTVPVTLRHAAVIEAGASRFRFLEYRDSIALPPALPPAPQSPRAIRVPVAAGALRTIVGGSGGESPETVVPLRPFVLSGQMVIGRDTGRAQIVLPHPRVSRVHARITLQPGTAVLTDLNSANGTFLNGRRLVGATTIRRQDRIDIGPYALVFDGQTLLPTSRVDNVELACRDVRRIVRNASTGQPLTLLDDISLVVRPGEFVCVLGPSGSGKSTLLSALSARIPLDHGSVMINGQDLAANFDALKLDVAVVPQQVALHEALAVEAALLYTARLRLPPDMGDQERQTLVAEMLTTVGLAERRQTAIRDLSGGQLKRAGLANEILSRPNLVLLDEVTSGLDEQTDREMMRLFRQLADAGKTVVCVTHSSANVEAHCHAVIVLAAGGKLAFAGPPLDALTYFGIGRLGDVYDRLSEQPPERWQAAFRQHPLHRQYVEQRLGMDRQTPAAPQSRNAPPPRQRLEHAARQTEVLARRYAQLQFADYAAVAMLAGQCLLVAFLLIVFYGDLDAVAGLTRRAAHCGHLSFLLAVSCVWFGCNNAAKEIVKERMIYLRERDVSVTAPSYYASKLVLLGAVNLFQATLLLGLIKSFTHLPGNFLLQLFLLGMLGLIGTTLGLLISALSKTNDTAIAAVPGVLLPQIILAGVIAPVEGFAKFLAQCFVSVYWGYRALAAVLPAGIRGPLGADDWSAAGAATMLGFHLLAFIVAALVVLLLADPSARVSAAKAWRRWSTRAETDHADVSL